MSLFAENLMASTGDNMSAVGDPVKCDGWYGAGDHLYTVAISVANFLGTIYLEGSLQVSPQDTDWFHLVLPVVFQVNSLNHTDILQRGETVNVGQTFRKNISWMRARMDRPGYPELGPLEYHVSQAYGYVNSILVKR